MARRRKKDWSRKPVPVGTIAIRHRSRRGYQVRFIKVRMDGPKAGRWIPYALSWWRRHRGPVPKGFRVAHLDGDTLNDDPANFGLLQPGDVLFVAGERDPKMWDRNRRAASKATAKCNRERGAVNRTLRLMPSLWYVVCLDQRWLLNHPRRSRRQALLAAGVEAVVAGNGRILKLVSEVALTIARGADLPAEQVRHFEWKLR